MYQWRKCLIDITAAQFCNKDVKLVVCLSYTCETNAHKICFSIA